MSVLRLGTNLRNQLVVRVLRKSAKLLSIIKFVNGFDKNISLGTRSSWFVLWNEAFLAEYKYTGMCLWRRGKCERDYGRDGRIISIIS